MSRDANWIIGTLKNLSFSYQIAQKDILSLKKQVSIYACYFCFTCLIILWNSSFCYQTNKGTFIHYSILIQDTLTTQILRSACFRSKARFKSRSRKSLSLPGNEFLEVNKPQSRNRSFHRRVSDSLLSKT